MKRELYARREDEEPPEGVRVLLFVPGLDAGYVTVEKKLD